MHPYLAEPLRTPDSLQTRRHRCAACGSHARRPPWGHVKAVRKDPASRYAGIVPFSRRSLFPLNLAGPTTGTFRNHCLSSAVRRAAPFSGPTPSLPVRAAGGDKLRQCPACHSRQPFSRAMYKKTGVRARICSRAAREAGLRPVGPAWTGARSRAADGEQEPAMKILHGAASFSLCGASWRTGPLRTGGAPAAPLRGGAAHP